MDLTVNRGHGVLKRAESRGDAMAGIDVEGAAVNSGQTGKRNPVDAQLLLVIAMKGTHDALAFLKWPA
jgi:hypothetical protein